MSRYGFVAGITRLAPLLVRVPLDTTTLEGLIFTELQANSFWLPFFLHSLSLSISLACLFTKFVQPRNTIYCIIIKVTLAPTRFVNRATLT